MTARMYCQLMKPHGIIAKRKVGDGVSLDRKMQNHLLLKVEDLV